MMQKVVTTLYWTMRLAAAVILLQTLFFKFSASDESVYIFTTVGMEPWGRIGVGVSEAIAAVLLVVPFTAWVGAGVALGLMLGAIAMHLTILGIVVMDDGGYLFYLAMIVAGCCVYVLYHDRMKIRSTYTAIRRMVS